MLPMKKFMRNQYRVNPLSPFMYSRLYTMISRLTHATRFEMIMVNGS